MEMLSKDDWVTMEQLLGGSNASETVMTVPMACGFMHGIAITPVYISPGSWIPVIYSGELPEKTGGELAELADFFIGIFNRYLSLLHSDQLVFPYSYDNLSEQKVQHMQEWLIGLHEAMQANYDLWMREEDPFIHNDWEEDVGLSLFYLHCLAWPEEVKQTLAEGDDFDPAAPETVTNLLSGLPSIVATLTRYGREMDEKKSAATEGGPKSGAQAAGKTGRNAPCPCGSGTKHKRCCGRSSASRPAE